MKKILKALFVHCALFIPVSSMQLARATTLTSPLIINTTQQTLSKMSVKEKIGQLFCVAAASSTEQKEEALASAFLNCPYNMKPEHIESLVRDYKVGGILYLFKSTPALQMAYTQKLQSLSTIPLLIAQDCEWGLSMRLYDTVRFPRNMTLGAIQNTQLLYELGFEIGKQCKAIGVDINLAPVVDINNNPANPVINDRSFGENEENVVRAAMALAQGMRDAGILVCLKHFPGHGNTAEDSHFELPLIIHTKEQLHMLELYPFKKFIEHQGTDAIMNAHLAMPALGTTQQEPSSLSYNVVTKLLKKELGFKGLVITDGLGMKAITDHYQPGYIELQAVLAGNDIILAPVNVPKAVELIEQALIDGKLTHEDLDEHVQKILNAKQKVQNNRQKLTIKEAEQFINRPYAKMLKKRLFEQAQTLVKNDNNCIPLSASNWLDSAVIEINAKEKNSVFAQKLAKNTFVYSVNSEIADTLVAAEQELTHKQIVIVSIFGMNKFEKESWGITTNTLEFLKRLEQAGKTVIVVLFGNPYSLKLFDRQASILVAYEDDPDAQEAAANVLLGDILPLGKLPVRAGIYKEGHSVAVKPKKTIEQLYHDVRDFEGIQPRQWSMNIPTIATQLDTKDNVVALTLDACGTPEDSLDDRIISFLKKHEIPATIFITSQWIKKHPEEFAKLNSCPLFDIENHGCFHKPCSVNGRSMFDQQGTRNIQEIIEEVMSCGERIAQLTGKMPRLYRSGTAYYDNVAVDVVNTLGYQVVNFDIVGDAGASYNGEQILQAFAKARAGSIIIVHVNRPERASGAFVPEAIKSMLGRGFKFVKLCDYRLL